MVDTLTSLTGCRKSASPQWTKAMFEFVAFVVARRDGVVVHPMRSMSRPAHVLTFILGVSFQHQLETGCKTEIFQSFGLSMDGDAAIGRTSCAWRS